MRIVAGQFKGRPIGTPKTQATRPTSDRARETLFNILAHADWAPALHGARVIDLFAGSGALGLEALSRGAAFCLLVETAPAARAAIAANIHTLNVADTAQMHRRSAVDLGPRPGGLGAAFDLAFIDPPYSKGLVRPCLESLSRGKWMADTALYVVEIAARSDLKGDETVPTEGWERVGEKIIGAAKFQFLQRRF